MYDLSIGYSCVQNIYLLTLDFHHLQPTLQNITSLNHNCLLMLITYGLLFINFTLSQKVLGWGNNEKEEISNHFLE